MIDNFNDLNLNIFVCGLTWLLNESVLQHTLVGASLVSAPLVVPLCLVPPCHRIGLKSLSMHELYYTFHIIKCWSLDYEITTIKTIVWQSLSLKWIVVTSPSLLLDGLANNKVNKSLIRWLPIAIIMHYMITDNRYTSANSWWHFE